MKTLSAILIFGLALLAGAAVQPVFYHATSGQTDYSRNLGFSIYSGDLVEQPFTPALASLELLDLGFYVFNGGLVDMITREGDGNGPIIASRLLQIGTPAPYNRTRMFFNPPVAVVPGAPYLLQLAPRPSNPHFTRLFDYFYNHREVPVEQRARRNGFNAAWALDYGFGIVVSDIFSTNRPPVVYYEQQPPVALFGDAVITNNFFAGPAQVDIEISHQSFLGDVYVDSNAATIPYVSNSWVTNNGNLFPQAILRILLNSNTTPAAFQEVLRNVRFQNFSNTVYDSFQFLALTCSNAFGEFRTATQLQIFGVDDPSAPGLDFQDSTAFWPATNRVALFPRGRHTALVYLNIYSTTDPRWGL